MTRYGPLLRHVLAAKVDAVMVMAFLLYCCHLMNFPEQALGFSAQSGLKKRKEFLKGL